MKIDKGIPQLPPIERTKWPFQDMEVGDSFWVPFELFSRIQCAATRAGQRHGKLFSVRRFENGFRCWRLK